MKNDQLAHNSVALEEVFFQSNDGHFTVERQQWSVMAGDFKLMNAIIGVSDEAVLSELSQLEVTPATLMAFSLFPAIHVAWADGKLELSEKDAILKSASHLGITSDSSAFKLLEYWLCQEPSAELLQAWRRFVHEVGPALTDAAFQDLRSAAMKRASSVARSAGGFLGFNKTSRAEKTALSELDAIFDRALSGKSVEEQT